MLHILSNAPGEFPSAALADQGAYIPLVRQMKWRKGIPAEAPSASAGKIRKDHFVDLL